jgi:hypothetical protein
VSAIPGNASVRGIIAPMANLMSQRIIGHLSS